MKLRTTRRVLSLLLALTMLFSLLTPVNASRTVEAPEQTTSTHWAAKELDAWNEKGWLNGNQSGDYMQDSQVSRAQFMTFVNRMMGYTSPSETVLEYADVPAGAWYYQDVSIALSAGYVRGTNGIMRPEAAISRNEAVVILSRLAGFSTEPLDEDYLALVPDAAAIPGWAKSAVSVAVREGFIAGVSGKFEGERSITRAESIVLLNRFDTNTRVFGFAGVYGGSAAAAMRANTVLIAAKGVHLKHTIVDGDVDIGVGVGEGESTLEDVVIRGNLDINGGGRNSVYLIRVTILAVLSVRKRDVRVVIIDVTDIKLIQLHANALLDVSSAKREFRVEIVDVPEGGRVTLDGNFGSVSNTVSGLELTIDGRVDTLILDAGAVVTGGSNVGKAIVSKEAGADTIFDKAPKQITGDGKGTVTVQDKTPDNKNGNNNTPQVGTIIMGNLSDMNLVEGNTGRATVTATASNGQTVAIAVATDTSTVASVSVASKTITITAVAVGTATITITASAANCKNVIKSFTVTVLEPGSNPGPEPINEFLLFDGNTVPSIYIDANDYKQIVRAVDDLRDDIERVTGRIPVVQNTMAGLGSKAIIVGSIDESPVIQSMIAAGKLDEAEGLVDKWESYLIKLVANPIDGVEQAIVIVGSDKRGGAYGIYDLSEQIGVSPWYYWGDILPKVQESIVIDTPLKIQGEPSVKYRGIFINDEQNMAYWAALTEEKEPGTDWENGNINPDTYAKVYELLLRLRANYLWPAMHSEPRLGPDANSTKTLGAVDHFNKYPENRILADEYGIIIGTSHCEPMMRNGTAEYVEYMKSIGRLQNFNFPAYTHKVGEIGKYIGEISGLSDLIVYDYSVEANHDIIDAYWRQGVEYYQDYETSYTLGMRGLHDEGFVTSQASTPDKKLAVLQEVIKSQREMLKGSKNPDSFPIFIPYKEVLSLYEAGLDLPAETIIVWAEDNHGYIRRFPTAKELVDYAGSGVYYHLNYEGTASYSWLNSVSPNLMLSEMSKAYESGAQALWVLNAGDIKPSEISINLFMEMAWDIDRWNASNLEGTESDPSYYELLAEKWFPEVDSQEVANLIEGYFHLVAVLKPDHTTGSTGSNRLGFSSVNYGDELMQRVAELQVLAERAQAIYDDLHNRDSAQADAFYQHVAYPILGTYYNNLKYYHSQKNALYLEQGRPAAANLHAALVDWAHEQEELATQYYNTGMSGGKWNYIMQPHNSNNVRADRSPKPSRSTSSDIPYISKLGVVAEGERTASVNSVLNFSAYLEDTHFIDLFNMGSKGFEYTVTVNKSWVTVSERNGTVYDDLRIFVDIAWANLPAGNQTATLTITGAGETKEIQINVNNPAIVRSDISGYAEANGYVAIEAEHFSSNSKNGDIGFSIFEGLGRAGDAVSAGPMGSATYYGNIGSAPYLTYEVYFQTAGTFPTTVYRIPTLETSGQRFAIGVNNSNPSVISGQNVAESGSWSRNITNGIEKCTTMVTIPSSGYHTIKLYMVDAGVAIDRIIINTGGEADSNQGPPESYHSEFNPNPGMYNENDGSGPRLLSMHREYLETYIAGIVNPLIENLAGEVKTAVQTALDDVTATLAEPLESDTVRRAYGKLASIIACVETKQNIDTLLEKAVNKGAGIILNGGAGIAVYRQEAVDAFETIYTPIAVEIAAAEGGLAVTEKMDYYEMLMFAMYTVEATRVMTVTADSSEAANNAGCAIDGDLTTRWAASGGGYPKWIQVDLGDTYILDGITINWFVSGTRSYKYTVSVSTDGMTFTQVLDRTGNTVYPLTQDTLTGTLGRYVRIDVTGATNNGGSASIFEIVISGTKPESAGEHELQNLRDEVTKTKLVDGGSYTIDSYTTLMSLASLGETLLLDGGSQEMVRQTVSNLQAAYAALKTKTIVFNDTFDDLDTLNDLEDWVLLNSGGTVSLENDGGNKYLKLEQKRGLNGGNEVAANKVFDPIAGKVYIEAKISSDTPQYFFGAPYVYNNASSATGNTNIMVGVAMRETAQEIRTTYIGGNSTATTKLGNFVKGEWYTITLVIDTVTNDLQVYLDGVRRDNGTWKLRNSKETVGKLSFYADDGNAGRAETTGYIDNVLVYTEGGESYLAGR